MAFPTVQTNSSGTAGIGTSCATTLPTGLSAGDMMVLYVARLNAGTTNAVTGWTKIVTDTTNAGCHECWWRRWQSGDTAPTVTGPSTLWVYRMLRISGASATTNPAGSTVATGTSTTPNPPSLTSGFGAVDTLWIAGCSHNSAFADPSGFPANYTNGLTIHGSSGPMFSEANRQLNAATEDPGTFTIGSSLAWTATTVAVPPAAALIWKPGRGPNYRR